MKNTKQLFVTICFFFLANLMLYAQNEDDDTSDNTGDPDFEWVDSHPSTDIGEAFTSFGGSYREAMEFIQGKGVLEEWFLEGFLPIYDEFMKDQYEHLTTMASIIAGLLALMYLSYLGWQFLSGERRWEIMPLLRPFALGLVIMNWGAFVGAVKKPFVEMQKTMYEDYWSQQDQVNAKRLEHYELKQKTMDYVWMLKADYDALEKESSSGWDLVPEFIHKGFSSLVSPVLNIKARLESTFFMMLEGLVEVIALWVLRICVYAVFFIQTLIQTILIILGPLAVAFSIIPAFSNSFIAWLQKFINVSLYGFIAFIVLKLGAVLQLFAFEAEIERYNKIIPENGGVNEALIISLTSSPGSSFGMVLVSFALTAIGMFLVPKLADYIVGSGGQHSAIIRSAGSAVVGTTTGLKGLK